MPLLSIFTPGQLRADRTTTSGLPATLSTGVGVPTLDRRVVEYANFDVAATAPALRSVHETTETVLRTYGSVHRGAGYGSMLTTTWYEAARTTIAQQLGARTDDVAIITRNTTDAFSLLAHALPAKAQVLVFESMHHAALLPWPAARTRRLPAPTSAAGAVDSLRAALANSANPEQTLVVFPGACNVTGQIWPVSELATTATEFGARTVLDAAQLAPHREVKLEEWGIDYVTVSGHKTYAPYGAGALVGRRDWLDAAEPYLAGGGATHNVAGDSVTWAPSPARHEGGTPNAIGAIALAAALTELSRCRSAAEAHERKLHDIIRDGFAQIDGVHVYEALTDATDNVGVTTFSIDGYDPTLVAQILADEYGIAVRDGRFCAHPLSNALFGEGRCAVRASIGLGSTREHAERLVTAVRSLVTDGPAFDYEHVPDVGYRALNDPRIMSEPLPW